MTPDRDMRLPVLLIEFNELSSRLLADFIAAGELPHFAAFRAASEVFATDAGEAGPTLVPWIQWPSIHTGMAYADHGIFHLGDAADATFPTIGSVLSEAGFSVGIFGSMNVPHASALRGFRLPDPWDRDGRTTPSSLQPFYDTVSQQVKESASHGRLSAGGVSRLAAFYASHGLRPGTVAAAARQLAEERLDGGVRWKRAALLDLLQYDVFAHYVRRHRPAFASFFSNSTAHYQHLYWRDMEPDRFPAPPERRGASSVAQAILYGYRNMDRLLGRFMREFPDGTLIFATGLSQEPYTGPILRNYRPLSFDALLAFAGVDEATVVPVMAHEFHVTLSDAAATDRAEAALRSLQVDDEPVFVLRRDGSDLFCGCRHLDPAVMRSTVRNPGTGARAAFAELFSLTEAYRSGQHAPAGSLWIRTGEPRVHPEPISILDIAPTVLAMFGLRAPGTMRGRSLELGAERRHERPLATT